MLTIYTGSGKTGHWWQWQFELQQCVDLYLLMTQRPRLQISSTRWMRGQPWCQRQLPQGCVMLKWLQWITNLKWPTLIMLGHMKIRQTEGGRSEGFQSSTSTSMVDPRFSVNEMFTFQLSTFEKLSNACRRYKKSSASTGNLQISSPKSWWFYPCCRWQFAFHRDSTPLSRPWNCKKSADESTQIERKILQKLTIPSAQWVPRYCKHATRLHLERKHAFTFCLAAAG